jgi:hypothetical protein
LEVDSPPGRVDSPPSKVKSPPGRVDSTKSKVDSPPLKVDSHPPEARWRRTSRQVTAEEIFADDTLRADSANIVPREYSESGENIPSEGQSGESVPSGFTGFPLDSPRFLLISPGFPLDSPDSL